MNHGNHIKYDEVIRFRNGDSALMKVKSMDMLCGYLVYHGFHLYGEKISIAANDRCRKANEAEMALWKRHKEIRKQYSSELLIHQY